MAKFQVGYYYTQYGICLVEAESAEDAERVLYEYLEENGTDEIDEEFDIHETTNREYNTQDGEIVP